MVFVHHMWGSHKTTRRHQNLVNELGFNCVSFDLLFGSKYKKYPLHPLVRYLPFGVFQLWKMQLHQVLDQLEGTKILYSFSGPSLSSLWVASERKDVMKVICDGGPFEQIYSNTRNFFRHEVGLSQSWAQSMASFLGTAVWGLRPLKKLHKVLDHWPTHIPILSIRGNQDDIVDIDSIRNLFNQHPDLPLTVAELPEGKHLDGLKNFPTPYRNFVQEFLLKSGN